MKPCNLPSSNDEYIVIFNCYHACMSYKARSLSSHPKYMSEYDDISLRHNPSHTNTLG